MQIYPIFISLKVVNIAVVFWAFLSRLATVWRILDILTLVSALVPLILFISAACSTYGFNGVTGTCEANVVETGALGNGGISGNVVDTGLVGLGGAATAGVGAAAAATGAGAAAVAGAPAAPTASFINGKWAVIVLPSSTRRASITPAFGDGTSIVVLQKVSILATISSAWTDSPTFV